MSLPCLPSLVDHINGSPGPAGGSNDGREARSRPWCATSAPRPSCFGPDRVYARRGGEERGKGRKGVGKCFEVVKI